ncbi:MAG: hypothetical protein WCI72_04220 [archaeon]
MSEYFSFDKSKQLCYVFAGDLSKSGIELSELLNGVQRLTRSRYEYIQKSSTEEKSGETIAVYLPRSFFSRTGSLIVKARTQRNPNTNFSGGEEKVGDVELNASSRVSRDLCLRIQDYLLNLEAGKKNE